MNKKVLVVDDDVKTVELVKLYLNRDGYRVYAAYDGLTALKLAREAKPDLLVLDIMLPGCDGLDVCRTLRGESDVPIILLTARTTEEDKLEGLGLGADDYVTKPFSPRELAARVRAVLRRLPEDAVERGPQEIVAGDLKINFTRGTKHSTILNLSSSPPWNSSCSPFWQGSQGALSAAPNSSSGYSAMTLTALTALLMSIS